MSLFSTGVLRIPRLPFECCCAFLPGPAGDFTRRRMDRLGEAYDEAILSLIREWDAEDDPSFGATWFVQLPYLSSQND